jgi:hypothetical protein
MSRSVRVLCLGALVVVFVSGAAGCNLAAGIPGGFPSISIPKIF